MCSCPTIIKNPYVGQNPSKGYNYLHDCVSAYIAVPCGKCRECISTKQDTYSVRAMVEKSRSIPFMLTLTYNEEMCPKMPCVGDVLDNFHYPDYKHVSDMFKRLRVTIARNERIRTLFAEFKKELLYNTNKYVETPEFKYLAVSEFGKQHLRPHFHILLFVRIPSALMNVSRQSVDFQCWVNDVDNFLNDWFKNNWSVNVTTNRKNPQYTKLYTYVRNGKYCTFDFHRIVKTDDLSDDSPVYYVTKYLYKFNEKLDKFRKMVFAKYKNGEVAEDRFLFFNKVSRMCAKTSNFFGFPFTDSDIKRVRDSIEQSKKNLPCYPVYFDPDGNSHPFPRMWKQRFLTLDDRTHFAYMFDETSNELIDFKYEYTKRLQSADEVERIAHSVETCDDSCDNLCGFCLPPDFLRDYESSSKAATPRFNYNDFGDDIESNFNNDRSTLEYTTKRELRHAQNPEIIILTLF